MMGKLLKHEVKSTYKTFLCMYGALAVIFITASLGKGLQIDYMSEIAIFAMSCAVLPVIMIYFVTVVKRYQKNIYGAESYLTHTLPVKTWEILLTKVVSAIGWGVLTLVVGLVFGIAMIWALDIVSVESWDEFFNVLPEFIRVFGAKSIWLLFAVGFTYCVVMVMQIYLSISVANLPIVTKANGLVALIVFFVLGRLEGSIIDIVLRSMEDRINSYYDMPELEFIGKMVNEYAIRSIVVGVGFVLVYFLVTHYILNKQLSVK